MTPEEVLAVARKGETMGCTEALFSLGRQAGTSISRDARDSSPVGIQVHAALSGSDVRTGAARNQSAAAPESRIAQRGLDRSPLRSFAEHGTDARNRQRRAFWRTGAAHDNAPDKLPAKRLRTIEEAGKQNVPFTTGLLIGIGESPEDRVDTLLAIRDLHDRYGHIQEVIVQNFRVKPSIPMAHWPEPSHGEMLRTVAVARLLLPDVNIQAPPNLSAPYYDDLMDAGINDWGGISPLTPDFINPEKPWPHLEQLRQRTEAKGFELQQRLPVYPEFIDRMTAKGGLLSDKLRAAMADDGLARRAA